MRDYMIRLYEYKLVEVNQFRIPAESRKKAEAAARRLKQDHKADEYKIE